MEAFTETVKEGKFTKNSVVSTDPVLQPIRHARGGGIQKSQKIHGFPSPPPQGQFFTVRISSLGNKSLAVSQATDSLIAGKITQVP